MVEDEEAARRRRGRENPLRIQCFVCVGFSVEVAARQELGGAHFEGSVLHEIHRREAMAMGWHIQTHVVGCWKKTRILVNFGGAHRVMLLLQVAGTLGRDGMEIRIESASRQIKHQRMFQETDKDRMLPEYS